MKHLVPGRGCGDCTLCCIVPVIDMPEAQKLPSSVCRHCASGCDIYETRPNVCRNYDCGWRQLEMFDETWRPDLSGVFIEFELNIPPQFKMPFGLNLVLVGNPLKTIRQPRFIDFVAASISNNRPLYLGLAGPRGMQACKLPLNTTELYDASRRGRSELRLALEKTLKKLVDHTYVPQLLEHAGNDMST
jgi:hypothetical protein